MDELRIVPIGELKEHLKNGPVKLLSGREVSLEEACRIHEVDPIIKRFGTWVVTSFGVECLTTHYAIPKARLAESDWNDHMIHKTWTVAYDVCDALDFAREHFMVTVKVQCPQCGIQATVLENLVPALLERWRQEHERILDEVG